MPDKLHQLKPKELGQLFPIILTEYNPNWPKLYTTEKNSIVKVLGPVNIVSIEHIGSTAIPGVLSKPTIDILIEIPDSTNDQFIIEQIKSIGYRYIPRPENPAPHIMFVKGYTEEGFQGQAFHIHVRHPGDWDEIYFRDYLIQHPEEAKEYAELKQELAEKFRNDREGYTEGKSEFVKRINDIVRNGR